MRLRKILDGETIAKVREQLPHDVPCRARPTRSEQRHAMLLVESPELAKRDRPGLTAELQLSDALRELVGLLLGELTIAMT